MISRISRHMPSPSASFSCRVYCVRFAIATVAVCASIELLPSPMTSTLPFWWVTGTRRLVPLDRWTPIDATHACSIIPRIPGEAVGALGIKRLLPFSGPFITPSGQGNRSGRRWKTNLVVPQTAA